MIRISFFISSIMWGLMLLKMPRSTRLLNIPLNSFSTLTKSKRLFLLFLSNSMAISISLPSFCSP